MANYQSIPRRFNKVTSNINHAYIDATLKEKQNTIDTNFGLLQQTVDQTLGQDLAREQDRDYLKSKVRGVLNTLEKTDQIKFDSKKARFTIQDALSEAAKDPEVLRQLANTRKIRQTQSFYQDRVKKGDLSQQNFQYAYNKSGINEYLSGESDTVGDLNYTEYVDVDAKLDEVSRKLKAANPNEKVTIQNPLTGEIVSKKVSLITPEEMRVYLRTQLNAEDLKQLEIDGSMMYGMDNNAAIQYRDSLIENNNRKYSREVKLLENLRDTGSRTPGQIQKINNQIKALGAEKASFEQGMIGQKTAEAIGGRQLIENKIDLFSKIYTKNGPESIKYDNDYLKRMRDANSNANITAQGGRSSEISTITIDTDLVDTINPYNDSLNRIDKTLRDNSNYLKEQFNNLSEGDKEVVQNTIEQIKNDPEVISLYKGQSLSNETLQLEAINRLGANFFPPDVAKELRSRISSTKSIQKGIQNTTDKFIKSKVLEKEVFDQLFVEETKLTMVTPEGDVNIQQFLKNNGVVDEDSYKQFIGGDTEEAKKLRATLALQSMSLTNDITTDDFYFGVNGDNVKRDFEGRDQFVIGATSRIDLNESEYRMMRQATHDLTGESLDETYNVVKKGQDYVLSLKNDTTQFSKILTRTNDLYQSGRQNSIADVFLEGVGFDIDRTVRNESSVRDLFSDKNYKQFAEENLDLLDKTVVGSNSIRIQGNIKKQVGPIYNEVLKHSTNITWDLTKPIDIYKKENGELLITQIVQDETALTNEEAKEKRKVRQGIIQANDVKKMTEFNNQVSLLQKDSSFSSLEDITENIDSMSFIGDNRKQIEGLNRLYDRNNKGENLFRLMSTEKTARDIIFNPSVDQYLNNSEEGFRIKAQFEDFVNNTENFKLNFTKGVDSDYQVIIKNKEDNSTVGTIPLNNNIPVETFEKAYMGSPQVFLSLYSKSRVDKYIQSLINGR